MQKRALQVSFFLLRVVAGLMFFQAGAMKILGWYGGMPAGVASPALGSQIGVGGIIELVCGALIMLGLCTRPIAFVCSGQMAVAYWQFHAPHGRWPVMNHGQQAVLLCFIFLYFAAAGAGDVSLDALIRKRREEAKPKAT